MKKLLIIILLLLPLRCEAAWAHVQTSGNVEAGADNNVAVTMGSNITSGSAIICWFVWSASTFSSIADTRTNTWNLVDTELTPGSVFFMRGYYALNSSSGADTITVTFSDANAANKTIICGEYSGLATSSALDQKAQQVQSAPGTGTDAISSSTTGTTASAPQLAISATIVRSGFTTLTAGSGWNTKRLQQDETFYALAVEDKNLSSIGTTTGTWTATDASNETGCQVATFKEPAGGGSSGSTKLLLMGIGTP